MKRDVKIGEYHDKSNPISATRTVVWIVFDEIGVLGVFPCAATAFKAAHTTPRPAVSSQDTPWYVTAVSGESLSQDLSKIP